jgi:hypothetical protein
MKPPYNPPYYLFNTSPKIQIPPNTCKKSLDEKDFLHIPKLLNTCTFKATEFLQKLVKTNIFFTYLFQDFHLALSSS